MTTETGMVERCARAVYASHPFNDNHDSLTPGFDGLSPAWREVMFANARAVLECLRTPTPEMVKAGLASVSGYPRPEAVKAIFLAMIDAALSPNPGEMEDGKAS